MKIAINAQFKQNSGDGGIEYYTLSLIAALGKLDDGNEEYIIIGNAKDYKWLNDYAGKNQKVIPSKSEIENTLKENFKKYRTKITSRILDINRFSDKIIPVSDGFIESLSCDLIHFPYQEFVITSLPSVFNPHDLQHKHLPQFFSPYRIFKREELFRLAMSYCCKIAVGSQWVKDDIIKQYNIHSNKIQVIPCAAPTQTYQTNLSDDELLSIRIKYKLPKNFIYYPAMTWKHKNHIRLIKAISLLKEKNDIKINLVCTGAKIDDVWNEIDKLIRSLNLEDQIQFLGLIPHEDVKIIYQLCDFVIVPTLFEAESGPIFEAWQSKKCVASSNVTSLPDQLQDTGVLFNPYSIEHIANAILILTKNKTLRDEYAAKGYKRGVAFSWEKTAKAYRALYRLLSRADMTNEDSELLNSDWMQNDYLKN